MKLIAIVPAGGSNQRYLNHDESIDDLRVKSKLDDEIHGQSVLTHVVTKLLDHPNIDHIIMPCHSARIDSFKKITQTKSNHITFVHGGTSRSESVYNACQSVSSDVTHVLIHDAARPNVQHKLITRVIDALDSHSMVIPAIPITDTIKRVNQNGLILETIDRNQLVAVQTPQGFHFKTLMNAFNKASSFDQFTDEASMCEQAGIKGEIVDGDINNIKITTKEDVERLRRFMTLPT